MGYNGHGQRLWKADGFLSGSVVRRVLFLLILFGAPNLFGITKEPASQTSHPTSRVGQVDPEACRDTSRSSDDETACPGTTEKTAPGPVSLADVARRERQRRAGLRARAPVYTGNGVLASGEAGPSGDDSGPSPAVSADSRVDPQTSPPETVRAVSHREELEDSSEPGATLAEVTTVAPVSVDLSVDPDPIVEGPKAELGVGASPYRETVAEDAVVRKSPAEALVPEGRVADARIPEGGVEGEVDPGMQEPKVVLDRLVATGGEDRETGAEVEEIVESRFADVLIRDVDPPVAESAIEDREPETVVHEAIDSAVDEAGDAGAEAETSVEEPETADLVADALIPDPALPGAEAANEDGETEAAVQEANDSAVDNGRDAGTAGDSALGETPTADPVADAFLSDRIPIVGLANPEGGRTGTVGGSEKESATRDLETEPPVNEPALGEGLDVAGETKSTVEEAASAELIVDTLVRDLVIPIVGPSSSEDVQVSVEDARAATADAEGLERERPRPMRESVFADLEVDPGANEADEPSLAEASDAGVETESTVEDARTSGIVADTFLRDLVIPIVGPSNSDGEEDSVADRKRSGGEPRPLMAGSVIGELETEPATIESVVAEAPNAGLETDLIVEEAGTVRLVGDPFLRDLVIPIVGPSGSRDLEDRAEDAEGPGKVRRIVEFALRAPEIDRTVLDPATEEPILDAPIAEEVVREADVVVESVDAGPRIENESPSVSAGENQTLVVGQADALPITARLEGSVSDDGVSGPLTTHWSVLSGPGEVRFEDLTSPHSAASFPMAGTYVLLLTADDAAWASNSSTLVTVAVNRPPRVQAGADQAVTLPASVSLVPTVADDGLSRGGLTTTWTRISGPGTVSFGDASNPATTAGFSIPGTYRLMLRASDGLLETHDMLTVTVMAGADAPAPGSSTGKSLYVALGGSDGNPGTLERPYRTIRKALEHAVPGDSVFIRGGSYEENIDSEAQRVPSGESFAIPLTIRGYPGEIVTLRPTGGVRHGISLVNGIRYTIWEDLILDGTEILDSGINVDLEANHNRFHNIEVRNTAGNGVQDGPLSGGFNEYLDLNVHDNARTGRGNGLHIASDNNLVDGGEYHQMRGSEGQSFGIRFHNPGQVHKNTIRNVRIYDNTNGLELGTGYANSAYNNLIYDNLNESVEIGSDTSVTTFNHNTVVGASSRYLVRVLPGASNTEIRNNILWKNGINPVDDQGTYTIEETNLFSDPHFVDERGADFRLSRSSPAVDAGSSLPDVMVDIDGVSRPKGFGIDIGAFELY